MSTTSKQEQMWESLHDHEFRKQIIDEHINAGIAFQIRGLRNRQKLTQANLAELLNVKQPLLSAWENPNYGKYTLKTLKDLAKAFDVGLLVRFVPFSTLVNWTINVTSDVIAPPNFAEEERNHLTPLSASNYIEATQDRDAYRSNTKNIPGLDATASAPKSEREGTYA